MKSVAPVAVSAAIFLIAIVIYDARKSRRAVAPAGPEMDEPAAPEIIPATLGAWTNLGLRASTPPSNVVRSVVVSTATNQPVAANGDWDTETAQARTRELLARAALQSVGSDPDADQLWLAAVLDERVPAEERRELILDLREAGFADLRRIAGEDLVLIAGRIALLEEVAQHALETADAAAIHEVYGDLLTRFSAATATETTPPTPDAE